MPKDFYTVEGGSIGSEDSSCFITCECGYGDGINEERMFIYDSEITRCPRCGKGYKTEFLVWQFDRDEEK